MFWRSKIVYAEWRTKTTMKTTRESDERERENVLYEGNERGVGGWVEGR